MASIDYCGEIRDIRDSLIALRRDIHKFPEPGWVEYRTSSLIADLLVSLGLEVKVGEEVCVPGARLGVPTGEYLDEHESRALKEGVNPYWLKKMKGGKTGVVGILNSNISGPIIALRFDIDANDLQESDNKKHRPTLQGFNSQHKGVMHACGHDGHVAIGLGVAKILARHRDKIKGQIRLIFQPAEEGCRGAKSIVDAGWLEGVDYFFSGHIGLKCGQIGQIVLNAGGFLATSKIDVNYYGKAAHAGLNPEEGRNALVAAAAATLAIMNIQIHSKAVARINVGMLKAGTGRNIIPDLAVMKLETRGQDNQSNEYLKSNVLEIIKKKAKASKVDYSYELVGEAPYLPTKDVMPKYLQNAIIENINNKDIIKTVNLGASEDVVHMIKRVQDQKGKAYYMIFGSELTANHHQNAFDFDEDVLDIAVENYCRLIFASIRGGDSN